MVSHHSGKTPHSNGSESKLRDSIVRGVARSTPPVNQSPCATVECAQHWAMAGGGGLLAMMGLKTRSLPGLALAIIGGSLVYRGLTKAMSSAACTGAFFADERPDHAVQRSKVDESSWESFPASDPPSGSRITA